MADFPTVRDDIGIINSIIKNRNSSAISELRQSSESASTNSALGAHYPKPAKRKTNRRHKGDDRRKNNRRQTRQNILLNTRSSQERRRGDRRNQEKEPNTDDQSALSQGVDILA